MPKFDLTKQQEIFLKTIIAQCLNFGEVAPHATNLDGTKLFGEEKGPGSLYYHCRLTKYKTLSTSFNNIGSLRCRWKPLSREESDPLIYLKPHILPDGQHLIRPLTEEEFLAQSETPIRSPRPLPHSPSRQTNNATMPPASGRNSRASRSPGPRGGGRSVSIQPTM